MPFGAFRLTLVADLRKHISRISNGFYIYERISSLSVNGECIYSTKAEADIIPSMQAIVYPLDQVSPFVSSFTDPPSPPPSPSTCKIIYYPFSGVSYV